ELENACERIAQTCACGAIRIGCVSAAILFGAAGQPPRTLPAAATAEVTPMPPPMMAPPPFEEAAPAAVAPPVPPPVFAPIPVGMMPSPISLDDRVREFESSLIRWALRATHGNKSRAAALLQIKRSTLGDRIVRCGLNEAAVEAPAE